MTHPFDGPISGPDSDLLDMTAYARQLASFIARVDTPYTIGIYGEWGAGKTSLVHLVRHYLADSAVVGQRAKIRFVSFTAWRYKSADELWRGLIAEIAQDLYELRDDAGAPAAARPSLLRRVWTFLRSDALVVRDGAPTTPTAREEYARLMERLRGAGSISRTRRTAQLDPDALAAAAAKLSLTAVSTMFPLTSALRSLIGLDGKVQPAQLLRAEQDAHVVARAESGQELVRLLAELIQVRARDTRLCIFVDDLDRCMPDAALDLLEAIRLFFGEVPCVFLVAADEQLVAQGLQLRLFGTSTRGELAGALLERGREYVEKIIQLGIRVPHRTYEQLHRLISAQFPAWTAATDIIHVAAGNNPRRAKQYSTWLTYKYTVARSPSGNDPACAQLFEKLVELQTLPGDGARGLDALAALASAPASYWSNMRSIEDALRHAPTHGPSPTLTDDNALALYRLARASGPLFELFSDLEPPILSQQLPEDVTTLVRLVAVKPDREGLLEINDATFKRIANEIAQLGSVDPRQLLRADLTRWILLRDHPIVRTALTELLTTPSSLDWQATMTEVERYLLADHEGDPAGLQDRAAQLCKDLVAERTSSDPDVQERGKRACNFLLQEPRFSSMPGDELRAYASLRDLPNPKLAADYSEIDIARAVAEIVWRDPSSPVTNPTWQAPAACQATLKRVLHDVTTRVKIAAHLLRLRAFAKLDALAYRWPALAQLLRADRIVFHTLESQILQPQAISPVLERWWPHCKDDATLHELVRLRPLFRDVHAAEIARYFHVTQTVPQAAKPESAPPPWSPGVTEPTGATEPMVYDDLLLTFTAIEPGKYRATMIHGSETLEEEIAIPDDWIIASAAELQAFATDTADTTRPAAVTRDITAPSVPASPRRAPALLRRIGTELYEHLFPGRLGERLTSLVGQHKGVRLTWVQHEGLAALPWECLYLPPIGPFVGMNRKCSVVRYFPPTAEPRMQPLALPLRVLVLLSSPLGAPPINIVREEAILQEILGRDPRVRLEVLRGPQASLSRLQERLRDFRPQIFHCVSHGIYRPNEQEGALIFTNPKGESEFAPARHLGPILGSSTVQLAFLNACDSGRATLGDAVSGVAGAIVGGGTPAVIATTRTVFDDPALVATRELYRAFMDGCSIEAALTEARIALNSNDWDWSAYGLFVQTRKLGAFRLNGREHGG